MFLYRAAQARLDSPEVFASSHFGFEVYLGPWASPGLHADRRTENIRNLLGDCGDLLLDHAAGDVRAIPYAHTSWGRGLELGDKPDEAEYRHENQGNYRNDGEIAVLHARDEVLQAAGEVGDG